MRQSTILKLCLAGTVLLAGCGDNGSSAARKALRDVNAIDETNLNAVMLTVADPKEAVAYFDERYLEIFQAELAAWDTMEENWPQDMSLIAFWEYFTIEIHDMVLDMEAGELNVSPVFDNMM